jgi:hypothetical protein
VKIQAFIQGTRGRDTAEERRTEEGRGSGEIKLAARDALLARARSIRRRNEGLSFISTSGRSGFAEPA